MAAFTDTPTPTRVDRQMGADTERMARRNTLGCLYHNRKMYRAAGNTACAEIFNDAIERRFALMASGEVLAGELAPVEVAA